MGRIQWDQCMEDRESYRVRLEEKTSFVMREEGAMRPLANGSGWKQDVREELMCDVDGGEVEWLMMLVWSTELINTRPG